MSLKSIAKKIVIFLLFLGLFSFVFSFTTDFSIPNISNVMLGTLFDHANTAAQENIVEKLYNNCLSLGQEEQSICDDPQKLAQTKANCQQYYELKNTIPEFEEDLEIEDACRPVLDGSLERSCLELQQAKEDGYDFNLDQLDIICSNYENNVTDGRTFFIQTLTSIIPEEVLGENAPLLKANKTFDIIFVILLIPFLVLLFYLDNFDFRKYLRTIGGLCLSIGIAVLIPILILEFYVWLFPLDTSSLLLHLEDFGEGAGIETELFFQLLPRVFATLLDYAVIIAAIIFIIIGAALKVVFKKEKDLLMR